MLGKVRFSGRENRRPGLNEAEGEGFLHRRFSVNVVDILFTLGKYLRRYAFVSFSGSTEIVFQSSNCHSSAAVREKECGNSSYILLN